jgi:glutathione synthase/RimK-type ligase-like ATP-grasp enzyme
MDKIYCLTDYQKYFGSKINAVPYNSGMDKKLLSDCFTRFNSELEFIPIAEVANYDALFWKKKRVIYTSSEDTGLHYKSFIEDIIYYLELIGSEVIPSYKYLRANNNKVFMELLRKVLLSKQAQSISSQMFGCFEEMENYMHPVNFPLVFKKAEGAMSKGVGLANSKIELETRVKEISRTRQYFRELWEIGRRLKYRGYKPQSRYRKKFIIQNFISGLSCDYKVLVFGKKYYVLKREAKKGDFRASGSGIRIFVKDIPQGLLEYAYLCVNTLNVPNVSLDIAFNGKSFYLIEFQCLYFGSYTLTSSTFYWSKTNENKFIFTEGVSVLEEEYVRSIITFCTQDESTLSK